LCSPAVLNLHGIWKPQSKVTLWRRNIHTKESQRNFGQRFSENLICWKPANHLLGPQNVEGRNSCVLWDFL
jgi:hypothetical protein